MNHTKVKPLGEMAEWSNATVLKTVVPKGTGGSNPSLSTQFKTKIKNMEYGEDFKKYAMSEHNVSSLNMDYHEKQIKGLTLVKFNLILVFPTSKKNLLFIFLKI